MRCGAGGRQGPSGLVSQCHASAFQQRADAAHDQTVLRNQGHWRTLPRQGVKHRKRCCPRLGLQVFGPGATGRRQVRHRIERLSLARRGVEQQHRYTARGGLPKQAFDQTIVTRADQTDPRRWPMRPQRVAQWGLRRRSPLKGQAGQPALRRAGPLHWRQSVTQPGPPRVAFGGRLLLRSLLQYMGGRHQQGHGRLECLRVAVRPDGARGLGAQQGRRAETVSTGVARQHARLGRQGGTETGKQGVWRVDAELPAPLARQRGAGWDQQARPGQQQHGIADWQAALRQPSRDGRGDGRPEGVIDRFAVEAAALYVCH